MRTSLLLACVMVSGLATSASADKKPPAPPADNGKGTLKPGQYAGQQVCRGSSAGINIEATGKRTIGVATCRTELQKIFINDKKLCEGKAKRTKIEYSWQFGEGEGATTGTHYFMCP